MKIAVVDNNSEYLARAKETLGGGGSSQEIETYEIDVTKTEQWLNLKEKVHHKFGGVDFLMLNAGISMKGTWGDAGYFQKVLLPRDFVY